MSSTKKWELPGRHIYNGAVYGVLSTKENLDQIKEFVIFPEDVVLVSHPKCGTVWLTEIAWLIKNNVDMKAARSEANKTRILTMDVCPPGNSKVAKLNQQPPGRLYATHLESTFFSEQLEKNKPKVIVLLRNPKDRLVSYFHNYRAHHALGNYPGTFSEFLQMDFEDQLHHGDYIKSALSWWKYRNEDNFLFVFYENMKKDLREEVKRIASFVGVDLTDEQLQTIVEHTSFDNMKTNPKTEHDNFNTSISSYMRKGIIGDWKNYFTVAENEIMDKILHEKLAGSRLEFTYE